MPTTPNKNLPYPSEGSDNAVAADVAALAMAVDAIIPDESGLTAHIDSTAAHGAEGAVVGTDNTQTLKNKTLDAPAVNDPVETRPRLQSPIEKWNVIGAGMGVTVTIDVRTAGVWFFNQNATADATVNIRGDGSTTLNALLSAGQSVTIKLRVKNGATPYRPTTWQIDGTTVTVRWLDAVPPTVGSPDAFDDYVIEIVKTASAAFTVTGSFGRFG